MSEDSQQGRTLIYSNRPPTSGASGGAMMVIEAAQPTWWLGPATISSTAWNAQSPDARTERNVPVPQEDKPYEVQTFPAPDVLADAQYTTISNEILWPVAHSMQPTVRLSLEQIEADYFDGYTPFNDLANNSVRSLSDENVLNNDDLVWVHDYQCANVPGMLFSSHIPWPEVDFLETVQLGSESGEDVAIVDTHFYRDYIENFSNRALISFQRPVDQANFIMTLAYVAGEELFSYESDHPDLQNMAVDVKDPEKRVGIQAALLQEIELGTMSKLSAFGSPLSTINVPVGQRCDDIYEEAKRGIGMKRNAFKMDDQGRYAVFEAYMGNEGSANLTACDPNDFNGKSESLTVADLVGPLRGRDWVFSVHRNDYTKGTDTKLDAAELVLEENPNATFLFVLQPTREDVQGYREYAQNVFSKANELRERFGEKSVVIIPEGVDHTDIMGLMRQPEMRGFMSLGHKDGHDLTVREVVDANDPSTAIGAITSSGIGASDVLGDGNKGSFVIADPTDAVEVADALREILDPANTESLKQRFDFMKTRSKQFDALNFANTIKDAYAPAMAHRFGENWRETFTQPDGGMIDRRGEHEPQHDERPAYLRELLNTDAKKPDPARWR